MIVAKNRRKQKITDDGWQAFLVFEAQPKWSLSPIEVSLFTLLLELSYVSLMWITFVRNDSHSCFFLLLLLLFGMCGKKRAQSIHTHTHIWAHTESTVENTCKTETDAFCYSFRIVNIFNEFSIRFTFSFRSWAKIKCCWCAVV